jgi:hypothetical protein
MSEFSETEFKLKRKEVVSLQEKITNHLLVDVDKNLNQHRLKNHNWFIQGTVHGICKALGLDKQLVIFLLLGMNPKRLLWGKLKEKYNVEPLKFSLRWPIISIGKKELPDNVFKLYLFDSKKNGDFHVKIVFFKNGEPEPNHDAVEIKKEENVKISSEVPTKTKFRGYAEAALRGKDKPNPAPLPPIKPIGENKFSLLADESESVILDEFTEEEILSEHSSVCSKKE